MSLVLFLDTTPPASPSLTINGGAAVTGSRVVTVEIDTPSTDAAQYLVWGDVDPTADSLIQPIEGASSWLDWAPDKPFAVTLSVGDGQKILYAVLRDDVGNQTLVFSAVVTLDSTIPVVTITTGVDRSRISNVAPWNTASFTWESNQDIVAFEVRTVPSVASGEAAGVVIPSVGGSVNTSGATNIAANTPVVTTINGADLAAASPGDTVKVCKVFVKNLAGKWSA